MGQRTAQDCEPRKGEKNHDELRNATVLYSSQHREKNPKQSTTVHRAEETKIEVQRRQPDDEANKDETIRRKRSNNLLGILCIC